YGIDVAVVAEVRVADEKDEIVRVGVRVVVVLDLLVAVLSADDDRRRPAAELADLARCEGIDREELAARVDLHEPEQVVDQLRRIRRAGAGERAAERVEVQRSEERRVGEEWRRRSRR